MTRHIPALDGLRAIAVTAVVFCHIGYGYVPGGFIGVDLFFVLSGYLITGLLLREFQESKNIRFDLFYLRRACRLLPAILLLLAMVSLMRLFLPELFLNGASWWFSSLAVLFFFVNFVSSNLVALGQTWTLSIEEQFYLLWPWILFLILKFTRKLSVLSGIPLFLILLCAAFRSYIQADAGRSIVLYNFLFTRMDALLLGALVAIFEETLDINPLATSLNRLRTPEIVILGIAFFAIGYLWIAPFLFYGVWTVIALLFALLILAIAHQSQQTFLIKILQSRAAVWIGKRSYGIYLYHPPIFFTTELLRTKHSLINLVFVTIFRIIATLAVAELSYRYVEMPFLRKKVLFKWNMRKPVSESPHPAKT